MSVEITMREVYDSVKSLHVQMAVLCEKLDHVGPRLHDYEIRIRSLESRRWPMPVMAGLAAISALFVVVKDFFT